MHFADDLVFVEESKEEVKEDLKRWRSIIERNDMKISRNKTIWSVDSMVPCRKTTL